jgi:hypothetical protein
MSRLFRALKYCDIYVQRFVAIPNEKENDLQKQGHTLAPVLVD